MHPFKSPRGLLLPLVALSVVALSLFALQSPVAGAAQPKKGTGDLINGVPDTGQFLPNSALLAKVADRKISVLAFRNAYFDSDPSVRPRNDSLGRAEFLTNMIRKDVLGLTALSSGQALGFEDRSVLREHQTTLLTNRLFEKEVLSIPKLSEDSLRKVFGYTLYDVRVRALSFADRREAEAAYQSLARGKETWPALAARVAAASGRPQPAEGSWWKFEKVPPNVALQLWPIEPGKHSSVLSGVAGYQILQVVERRPVARPAFEFMRVSIENTLDIYARGVRKLALMQEAKEGLAIRYDSTNAAWAANRFFSAVQSDSSVRPGTIVIDERVPDFAPADTARTLVTCELGRVSLGQLLVTFSNVPAAMRPVLNTTELLLDFADAIMLAPRLTDLALKRGLDKDPVLLQRVERKREELLVIKMVEDSCFSRISVTPKERRDYYQKHRNSFVTYPEVRAAFIVRDTKVAADSVRARLDAGQPVAGILRADSLRGEARSGTKVISSETPHPMHKLLFEEMRPGQRRVMGPDKQGYWACVQLLEFDPGQQVPYEEVETVIDESIRNLKAEQVLQAFTARLMKRYPVETHYERLMSVKLTTPGDDERE